MGKDHLEVELKYEIDKSTYGKIKSYFADSLTEPKQQANIFFDTKDKKLLESRWVLRIRREEGKSFITVKGESRVENALHTRVELEEEIPNDVAASFASGFNLSEIDSSPCRKIIKSFGDLSLLPFARFTNERIEIPWEGITLELDRFVIGRNTFYELEAEIDPERSSDTAHRIKKLFSEKGWQLAPSTMSKFARTLSLMDQTD
jgi:uncharacterized protein YjbK